MSKHYLLWGNVEGDEKYQFLELVESYTKPDKHFWKEMEDKYPLTMEFKLVKVKIKNEHRVHKVEADIGSER